MLLNKNIIYVDPDLEDLIPGFLQKVYSNIKLILEYIDMAEYEKIIVIAQHIKGGGGGYGFEKITELGRIIEKAAKDIDSEQISKSVNELSEYLEKIEVRYEFRNMIILCVDDDKHALDLTKRFLSGFDYDVVSAQSGLEALEKLETIMPQLILLDIVMPEMDGYAVCEKLQERSETKNIPVIFLTALEEEQDKAKALSYGAVDYIVKPIKKDMLLGKIKQHINTNSRWKKIECKDSSATLSEKTESSHDFNTFKYYLFDKLDLSQIIRSKYSNLSGNEVYSIIVDAGIEEDVISKHISDYLKITYVPEIKSEDVQLGILPASFCRSNLVVPVIDTAGNLCFAMCNPFLDGILENIKENLPSNQVLRLKMTKPDNIWDLSLTPLGAQGRPY